MNTNSTWTVRVINPNQDTSPTTKLPGLWVEQLRHAGVLNVLREDNDHAVLEFLPPASIHKNFTINWARQEAERMQSFGILAAPAPKWEVTKHGHFPNVDYPLECVKRP